MLAAKRKRLARRTARDKLNLALVTAKIHVPHVILDERPTRDGLNAASPVLADGVTTPAIPLVLLQS
jgi:hypothetical protein